LSCRGNEKVAFIQTLKHIPTAYKAVSQSAKQSHGSIENFTSLGNKSYSSKPKVKLPLCLIKHHVMKTNGSMEV